MIGLEPPRESRGRAPSRPRRRAPLQDLRDGARRATDLIELFRELYQTCNRLLDATIFFLGIYDQVADSVHVVRQVEAGVELPGGVFPLGSGFSSQVIRTRQPVLISDWSRGPHVQVQYASRRPGLPSSTVTVPIIFEDRVVGVLSAQSYRRAAYGQRDLATLTDVAAEAGTAIARLHRGQAEFDAILAHMVDGVLVVDAEGRIVRLNGAARRLLALDDGHIVLGRPLDRRHWREGPSDARELARLLEPMIDALRHGDAPQDVDVELRTPRRVFNFSGTPLRDVGGALNGGVLVFRDVTTRREIERLKDEIVSIASHDLRTPVGVIKGQAQILRRGLARQALKPEDVQEAVTMILGQSNRLTGLLTRLLDFSRLESGRFHLQLGRMDLRALVDRLVRGIQATTERHQLEVIGPPRLEGVWDEQRLAEVVENLLTNAVKYSPAGGPISVGLAVDELEDTVSVRVQDRGVGLSAASVKHVFERYYRARRTRRLEGTGLGLYVCHGIVAAHGGQITAESAGRGRGSTFCVTLPRITRAAQGDDAGVRLT
jgi:two-component system, OmpR family, phosphate regulon sensor histidine kinase PhoR